MKVTDSSLLVETDDSGVARMTLNRPIVHNAFDSILVEQMHQQLKWLSTDSSVRVLLLSASGKDFCAGANLNWMRQMSEHSEEENMADARRLAELMATLNEFPRPVVAQVRGTAYGGGIGLLACSDIVIAEHGATFCLSEVKLGLTAGIIGPYVIAAIGERASRRYFLSAELFSAEQAYDLGLVHEVVNEHDIESQTESIITTLLNGVPQAQEASKELIHMVSHQTDLAALRGWTAALLARLRASNEDHEGITAFLQKRSPKWRKKPKL